MEIELRTWLGPLLLLLLLPSSARGQEYRLQQSPELPVSTSVLSGPIGDVGTVAIATSAEESLIVWRDHRDGEEWQLYGALVKHDGSLSPISLPIASAVANEPPAVAFNGTHFLVTWAVSAPEQPTQRGLWARRISREGQFVDAAPFAIALGEPSSHPRVSAVGDVWFVVFEVYRTDATKGDILGVRVGPEGNVRDSSPLPIAQGPETEYSSSVGTNGTNWLVAWREGQDFVRCVLVPPTGPVSAAVTTLSTTADSDSVEVASDGSQFLVVWDGSPLPLPPGLYGARVGADGSVMGAPFLIHKGTLSVARVAYAAGQYLVTLNTSTNVSLSMGGIRVSSSGTVLDASPIPLAEGQQVLGVAPAGSGFRVTWSQGQEVLSLPVGADGQPGPSRLLVNRALNAQYAPAVAFDGKQFLVVWEDGRSGGGDIHGARLLPDGSSLDGAGFPISAGPGAQKLPAVTFDGTRFIVAWQDERSGNKDVFAARVTSDGTVVDPEGLPVASSPNDELTPALASDGHGGVLATWHEVVGFDRDIRGARMVQGQFTPLTAPLSGSVGAAYTGTARNLGVAYGGGSYLVVWATQGTDAVSKIWGAVVPAAESARAEFVFTIGAELEAMRPAVAFDGTSFLVTWVASFRSEARARRVSPRGTLESQEWVLGYLATATRPAVAFDGSAFIVAWEKAGGRAIEATAVSPLGVKSGRVEIAGEPFSGAGAGHAGGIALAGGPQGESLLTVARFDAQLEQTVRVRARLLTSTVVSPDAGTGGGADGGTEEPPASDSGCGCSSASGPLVFGAMLLAWLSALNSRAR